MNTIRKLISLLQLCLLLGGMMLPQCLGAQEASTLSRAQIDSLVNPPVWKDGEKQLRFTQLRQDIGTLSEDDAPVHRQFTFRNISSSGIRIVRISTGCGCTTARCEPETIAAGGTGTIVLTYSPKDRPGTVDVSAYVYTEESGKLPAARLSLTGNVTVSSDVWKHLPLAAGHLRLKCKRVTFTEVTSSTRPSERIVCGNSGQTPLKLTANLLPDYASFHTEPATLQPGEEGDLVITIDGSKLPATTGPSIRFSVLLEGISGRPSERMISVEIKRQ
ncbi:MAG: DUF1573 domain-containing protein [Bacteroides sp.]|nr:DUF1573 domain-containing protein [Bacteroides sp.]